MSGRDTYIVNTSAQRAKVRSVLEVLNRMRENEIIHPVTESSSFVVHFQALLDCRDVLIESLNEISTNAVATALEKLHTLMSKNTSWDPRYENTVGYVMWTLIMRNATFYDHTDFNAVQDQSKSRLRRTSAYRPNLNQPQSYRARYLPSVS